MENPDIGPTTVVRQRLRRWCAGSIMESDAKMHMELDVNSKCIRKRTRKWKVDARIERRAKRSKKKSKREREGQGRIEANQGVNVRIN